MRLLGLVALLVLAAPSDAQELKRQDTERSDTERLRNQCTDLYRLAEFATCATLRLMQKFGDYPAPPVELPKCEEVVASCRLKGLWPFQMDDGPLIPLDLQAPGAVRARVPHLPGTGKE